MILFFDANISPAVVAGIRAITQIHKPPKPILQHIYELHPEGVSDDIWVPTLLNMDCLIISGDKGKKEPRLPDICRNHDKTHIIFSPAMHHNNSFQKARSIISLWPDIVGRVAKSTPGSRWQIQLVGCNQRFALVQKS